MALPAGATNWDAVGGPGAGRPARVGPARERRTGGSQMRVMLAFDGSAGAEAARDLVAHLRWPTGTAITVVAALERGRDLFGAPDWAVVPRDAAESEALILADLQESLRQAADPLRASDRIVETRIARGRAARPGAPPPRPCLTRRMR